jgi:hypothetical protein
MRQTPEPTCARTEKGTESESSSGVVVVAANTRASRTYIDMASDNEVCADEYEVEPGFEGVLPGFAVQ